MTVGKSLSFGNFNSLPPNEQQELLNGSALKPPTGMISHLDNPPNRNTLNYVLLSIFLTLITIGLAGRIGVRSVNKQLFIGDCQSLKCVPYIAL